MKRFEIPPDSLTLVGYIPVGLANMLASITGSINSTAFYWRPRHGWFFRGGEFIQNGMGVSVEVNFSPVSETQRKTHAQYAIYNSYDFNNLFYAFRRKTEDGDRRIIWPL